MQAARPDTIEGKEFDSVNSFMQSREGASQNLLVQSFMDWRTQSPVLAPDMEEDNAPKEANSVYDIESAVLTPQQMNDIKYYGRAGSSLTTAEEDNQKAQDERNKKDQAANRYLQQELYMLKQLTQDLSRYQTEQEEAVAELAALRQEIDQARQVSQESAERFDTATQAYEINSQQTADFREEMGDQVVTINGKEISLRNGILVDQEGKAITAADLAGSDNPMATSMEQYLADQLQQKIASRQQYSASMTQSNADVQAAAAEEKATQTEEKIEALDEKIKETETQIQEIQDNNPELSAAVETETSQEVAEASPVSGEEPASSSYQTASLETESSFSASPRTASAVAETGLVEENRVAAPSMRDGFKASAEGTGGTPQTPDASTNNNPGQTIEVATLSQQQLQTLQQRQYTIA